MTRTPTLYQMWHVVLPLKGTPDAKSRLDLPRSTRDRMVHAMAADTLEALLAAAEVQKVSILSRRRDLSLPSTSAAEAEVIVQPRGLGFARSGSRLVRVDSTPTGHRVWRLSWLTFPHSDLRR